MISPSGPSHAELAFDSLARGDVLPAVDLTISGDDVRAYLEATGERVDHWNEHVPPVMLSALMLATLLAQVEIPKGIMHTGHEHEARRAVRIGEPLRITVQVTAHSVRRGALMASFETTARSAVDGGDVAVSRASVMVPPAEGAATSEGEGTAE